MARRSAPAMRRARARCQRSAVSGSHRDGLQPLVRAEDVPRRALARRQRGHLLGREHGRRLVRRHRSAGRLLTTRRRRRLGTIAEHRGRAALRSLGGLLEVIARALRLHEHDRIVGVAARLDDRACRLLRNRWRARRRRRRPHRRLARVLDPAHELGQRTDRRCAGTTTLERAARSVARARKRVRSPSESSAGWIMPTSASSATSTTNVEPFAARARARVVAQFEQRLIARRIVVARRSPRAAVRVGESSGGRALDPVPEPLAGLLDEQERLDEWRDFSGHATTAYARRSSGDATRSDCKLAYSGSRIDAGIASTASLCSYETVHRGIFATQVVVNLPRIAPEFLLKCSSPLKYRTMKSDDRGGYRLPLASAARHHRVPAHGRAAVRRARQVAARRSRKRWRATSRCCSPRSAARRPTIRPRTTSSRSAPSATSSSCCGSRRAR